MKWSSSNGPSTAPEYGQVRGIAEAVVVQNLCASPRALRSRGGSSFVGIPGTSEFRACSESCAIISSMNLYAPTARTTVDLGITTRDPETLTQIRGFLRAQIQPHLIAMGVEERLPAKPKKSKRPELGHCIRCGITGDLDPGRPLCEKDYRAWARYSDPEYAEKFCHACGEPASTSMSRPLCREFFRRGTT